MSVLDLARAERADLLDLVTSLTPEQWEAPSLCTGWRVRDVVAHVVSLDGLGPRALAGLAVRGRGTIGGMNGARVEDLRALSTDELVDLVRRHQDPGGLPRTIGGRIALTDGLVHQQDVRRPLGLPRVVPAERLRVALTFALWAPPVRGILRGRGLRLVADDAGWTFGRGPEVRGSGEALLMALAGRPAAVADLTGDGVPVLSRRLGRGSSRAAS